MKTLLTLIALILVWAVTMWRNDVAKAESRIQHKRQRCADAFNQRMRDSYNKWWDDMTDEGYAPTYLSNIRHLTPDEIGVEEWQVPEDYLKLAPDWRTHPDNDKLIFESYTDSQRAEMKQPDFEDKRQARRKVRL